MSTPEVTVVVPTRDRPTLLSRTLGTVLAQRGVDLEVVVVDDGSEDPAVVTGLSEVADPRVSVLRNEVSGGVAAARNLGVDRARGTWVAMTDDDDLWHPDKLRTQLEATAKSGAVWAVTGALHFLPGPRVFLVHRPPGAARFHDRIAHENVVPAGSSNVLARREAFLAIGGFDEGLRHLADWDAWCKLSRLGTPALVDEVHVAYRLHDRNMVLISTDGLLEEVAAIEARTTDLRAGAPLDRTAVHRWIATMLMRAGRRAEARRSYLDAMRAGDRRAPLRVVRTFVPFDDIRNRVLRQAPPEVPTDVARWLRAVEPVVEGKVRRR